MTSVKQRIKIKEPWVPEVYVNHDQKELWCDLVNIDTGEIRRIVVDFDTLARRIFGKRINGEGYKPILTEPIKKVET